MWGRSDLVERLATLLPFAGQKPKEGESIRRQPRRDQSGEYGRRSRNGNNTDAGLDRRLDESLTRIGQQWRSGVRDEGDVLTSHEALNQPGRRPGLVMLVVRRGGR